MERRSLLAAAPKTAALRPFVGAELAVASRMGRFLAGSAVSSLLLVAGGSAALILGKPFLLPLAFAVVIAFWLSPAVAALERLGLGRAPAVVLMGFVVACLLAGATWLLGRELVGVVSELPQYRKNLIVKAQTLRGAMGPLARTGSLVDEIVRQIDPPTVSRSGAAMPQVELVEPTHPLDVLRAFVGPTVEVLGVAGLVVLLAMLMLIQRDALHARIAPLLRWRERDLTLRAIDDAGSRLSRYLSTYSIVAAIHGALTGLGLAWIGIPGAFLWGVAASLARFVPYLGPWCAAALPLVVAVAAFPTWTPALLAATWVLLLELVTNNVLETWLCGGSLGLSPLGVVLAVFYWTWVWGVPGLLLAMPLTGCAVVAARHVRGLEPVVVLLENGSAPPDAPVVAGRPVEEAAPD